MLKIKSFKEAVLYKAEARLLYSGGSYCIAILEARFCMGEAVGSLPRRWAAGFELQVVVYSYFFCEL